MVSKETQKLFKKGKLTGEMVCSAIYSYDVREKNYRNKEYQYRKADDEILRWRGFCLHMDSWIEKAEKKKDEYHDKKIELLKYFNPSKIFKIKLYTFHEYYEKNIYAAYYELCDYWFWKNITKENAIKSGLKIETIDRYSGICDSKDVKNLMPCQMADKIRNLLNDGIYEVF